MTGDPNPRQSIPQIPAWIVALFDAAAKVPLTGEADPFRNRIRRLI